MKNFGKSCEESVKIVGRFLGLWIRKTTFESSKYTLTGGNGLAYLVGALGSRRALASLLCHFVIPSALKTRSDDPDPSRINEKSQR